MAPSAEKSLEEAEGQKSQKRASRKGGVGRMGHTGGRSPPEIRGTAQPQPGATLEPATSPTSPLTSGTQSLWTCEAL
jgi:hypothetical protein